MQKRILWVIVLLVVLITLSFFSSDLVMLHTYHSKVQHVPQMERDNGEYLEANNYNQLKDQIISLVESAKNEGNIRLYDYLTDVEEDLSRACYEVMNNSPIGVYAVEKMTYDHTRVLSYYDVKISIVYNRSQGEILNLVKVDSVDIYREVIKKSLLDFKTYFALQINYYTDSLYNPDLMRREIYFSEPDTLYGLKDYNVQFFPVTGVHKILRFENTYAESADSLRKKREEADQILRKLTTHVGARQDQEKLHMYADSISDKAHYVQVCEEPDQNTPYGVLMKKRGTSLGYAATFKKLCDLSGIPCIIVDGTLDGAAHIWNMVYVDDIWYHVDLSVYLQNPQKVLWRTEEMKRHRWDDLQYPVKLR